MRGDRQGIRSEGRCDAMEVGARGSLAMEFERSKQRRDERVIERENARRSLMVHVPVA